MHKLRTIAAGIAVAATAAMVAGALPALADPPIGSNHKQIVPADYDIVSVGANTDENLFNQLAVSYDVTIAAKQHSASLPYLYTWNATAPGSTSTAPTKIVTKAGCGAEIRPNGSGAGLTALDANTLDSINKKYYCIDFARSSSGRSSKSPAEKPGGVGYVALAQDAVTYAVRDVAPKGQTVSYAPKSLTLAQLKAIFLCTATTWDQVGGTKGQPIKAYLPQTASGTYSFFIKALGITAPGSCVNTSLEENQGLSKQFNSPNAIFIYSVGDWIAQNYHSPLPGKKPTATQNKFGSDNVGYLGLGSINGVSPVIKTAAGVTINKKFKSTGFTRTLYDIVRYQAKGDHIPASLDRLLSRTGYFCHNSTATKAIESYGFLPALTCGTIS
jgi:ABC-type phosphate transport system substrate-binding protein